MIGDYNSIAVQKGAMTLCFEIVIPTDKGAIYCVYLKCGCEMAYVVTQGMEDLVVTTMTIKQLSSNLGTTTRRLLVLWL
jgi:hypothetical protein